MVARAALLLIVIVCALVGDDARADLPRLRAEDAPVANDHKKRAREHAKKKDELLATAEWRKAAELGDPEAQFTLARRLERGLGVMDFPDVRAAAKADAQRYDAAALAQRYPAALERIQKEAERGDGGAQADLATSLQQQGRWEEAVDFYRAAVIQDSLSPAELAHAADILAAGRVEPEPGEVEALYRRAIARGYEPAEVGLAKVLFEGLGGVKRDTGAARRVLERGAADDHLEAVMELGRRLEAGDGVGRDHGRALQVYKKSRHRDAKLAEARLLVEGDGRRDPKQAVGALSELARGGWFPAVDRVLALAAQGELAAQLLIAEMYLRGTGIELDQEEAAYWYGLAADRRDPTALFALGQMHLRGEGVPKNPEVARDFFVRAHQAGSREASRALGY